MRIRLPIPLIVAAMTATAAPALAQSAGVHTYSGIDHNGSVMRVDRTGDLVSIRYDRPREGLAKAGVMPGMLVFEGHVQGGSFVEGRAYVYKHGCTAAPYVVRGSIIGTDMTLQGPAPQFQGCAVAGLNPNSGNAFLVFHYLPAFMADNNHPVPNLPDDNEPTTEPKRSPQTGVRSDGRPSYAAPGQRVGGCDPMDAACLHKVLFPRVEGAKQEPPKAAVSEPIAPVVAPRPAPVAGPVVTAPKVETARPAPVEISPSPVPSQVAKEQEPPKADKPKPEEVKTPPKPKADF